MFLDDHHFGYVTKSFKKTWLKRTNNCFRLFLNKNHSFMFLNCGDICCMNSHLHTGLFILCVWSIHLKIDEQIKTLTPAKNLGLSLWRIIKEGECGYGAKPIWSIYVDYSAWLTCSWLTIVTHFSSTRCCG